ncbi:double-strand break repair protein AddB [Sphingomonas sp. ASV193]|uniref:double-strand break repair protein AddB n=1 Tax=Sphingomonas sp. ASV193 TaxID=3144405 RepID=UPI0032E8A74B
MAEASRPAVFTIPAHRSFADALVAGLIRRHGRAPDALAGGRILLPNNRAVRTVTEAFVRASGGGLLLPRLIAIGDPEIDDRIGGALDAADLSDPLPPAIDPLDRQLLLAGLLRRPGESAAETMRLAADLARALDALLVEEVPAARLRELRPHAPDLAGHWQRALDRFEAVLERWPRLLAERGRIDLAGRRSRLLHGLAARWRDRPPPGFTIAAGITTAAPAVAALLAAVARIEGGAVVLPGLALADSLPEDEWEALGPDADGRGEERHPQYHLKQLLDRMGIARAEVERWPAGGRAASPAVRSRAVAHALTAAEFSDKWASLPARERRLTGVRCVELADAAAEAQAIAIALREALERPGETAALVTPDRGLAARVAAHLQRWGIAADDSAGQPLGETAPGTLLLSLVAAADEQLAPVPLLALLKHPLVGGEGEARLAWLDDVRALDLALRGPRPRAGLAGLDAVAVEEKRAAEPWSRLRPAAARLLADFAGATTLAGLAAALREAAQRLAGDAAWRGPAGRAAAELLERLETSEAAAFALGEGEALPLLRDLLAGVPVRRPYGGHPRIFIWGLLEARLQHADLMILGGMNEGVWPSLPSPDPWLAPSLRRLLGLPGLDTRTGLAAHDFAGALGAPRVLLTRARRDSAPTVASRLWRRLQAMTGGVARDVRLERLAATIDRNGIGRPADRPAPSPPVAARPRRIKVTALDRLKADPYAFYAEAILRLRPLEPVDAEQSAAWKGSAVHEAFEAWFEEDRCDPAKLRARAEALLASDNLHPMLRALWSPRLLEAIDWVAATMTADLAEGRRPLLAEVEGQSEIDGVTLLGRVDRIDRLPDGRLAIVDYKTGKPPAPKAVREGYALQLGLLALIAERTGFGGTRGPTGRHEYWSLAKDRGTFGKRVDADKELGAEAFVAHAARQFAAVATNYLTGDAPFVAKLNPAYAPYGDYDQLMRLEEWYGRDEAPIRGETGEA